MMTEYDGKETAKKDITNYDIKINTNTPFTTLTERD